MQFVELLLSVHKPCLPCNSLRMATGIATVAYYRSRQQGTSGATYTSVIGSSREYMLDGEHLKSSSCCGGFAEISVYR